MLNLHLSGHLDFLIIFTNCEKKSWILKRNINCELHISIEIYFYLVYVCLMFASLVIRLILPIAKINLRNPLFNPYFISPSRISRGILVISNDTHSQSFPLYFAGTVTYWNRLYTPYMHSICIIDTPQLPRAKLIFDV